MSNYRYVLRLFHLIITDDCSSAPSAQNYMYYSFPDIITYCNVASLYISKCMMSRFLIGQHIHVLLMQSNESSVVLVFNI